MAEIDKLRLDKKGVSMLLSPLEAETLHILWKMEQAKVKEIHKILRADRKVALTSIAVTLDRLHQKGIVSRTVEKGRGGGHYIYSPKTSRQEFEESILDNTVNKLINAFGPVAANYFYKRFSKKE